jgi:HlyD family secretion protein
MRLRRILLTILLAAILLAGGTFAVRAYQSQQKAAENPWQTQVLKRGPLTGVVNADSTLASRQAITLSWEISGIVASVNVKVGDTVKDGDVLASLDPNSLSQSAILSEVYLANAQKSLDDLYKQYGQLDLAQARQKVADGEQHLDNAQKALQALKTPASQAEIDQAKANVLLSQDKLEQTQQQIEIIQKKMSRPPSKYSFWESKKLYQKILEGLQRREISDRRNYEDALAKLGDLQKPPDPVDLANDEAELSLAQAQLQEARKQLSDLEAGPTSDDIRAAQAQVDAAQAQVDKRRILAPISATVTRVNVKPGDQAAPGQLAFRLDDISQIVVNAAISEVDVNRLQAGQLATLHLDAAPGRTYHGHVSEVLPVGENQQGVVNFTTTITLDDADLHTRPGMTASVDIQTDRVEDALLLPTSATRFLNGQQVVYILNVQDQPQAVPVELGISAGEYSQVLSGNLKAGDRVVLNPPSPTPNSP